MVEKYRWNYLTLFRFNFEQKFKYIKKKNLLVQVYVSRKMRAGKGSMVVYNTATGYIKAFGNIPGVNLGVLQETRWALLEDWLYYVNDDQPHLTTKIQQVSWWKILDLSLLGVFQSLD